MKKNFKSIASADIAMLETLKAKYISDRVYSKLIAEKMITHIDEVIAQINNFVVYHENADASEIARITIQENKISEIILKLSDLNILLDKAKEEKNTELEKTLLIDIEVLTKRKEIFIADTQRLKTYHNIS